MHVNGTQESKEKNGPGRDSNPWVYICSLHAALHQLSYSIGGSSAGRMQAKRKHRNLCHAMGGIYIYNTSVEKKANISSKRASMLMLAY